MSQLLRVLIVEDSENDAILLLRELRHGGYEPTHVRVDTPEAMNAALEKQRWDIVLSDYVMPRFDGLRALDIMKKRGLDLPFIIISGQIGEDMAVQAMRAGAHDYIMKGNLKRLVPAINRELGEAESRKERRMADEARRRAELEMHSLARRLVRLQEDERRAIALELHDQVGQNLAMANSLLSLARRTSTGSVVSLVEQTQVLVKETIGQVRSLSLELRPSMLDDLGLESALSWLFERYSATTQIKVQFRQVGLTHPLPPEISIVAFRIVQESLTNVARYAGVNEVQVSARLNPRSLSFSIEDRGKGFNPAKLRIGASNGLSGMRERARLLGGTLRVKSAPGAGTTIRCRLPLRDQAEAPAAE